jgi:hypothetical protein
MQMTGFNRTGKPPVGRLETLGEELNRNHNEIVGLERRLADCDEDVSVARLALARRYAAFAVGMVRRAGGDVQEMKSLTDRNNIIPLAGAATVAGVHD